MTSAARRARLQNLPLVALAIVGVALVVLTQGQPTTAERMARQERLLEVFEPANVTRLAFERDDAKFSLARAEAPTEATSDREPEPAPAESIWRFEGEMAAEAEPDEVDRILNALRYAGFARRLAGDAASDRQQLGLDQPAWVLTAELGDMRYRLRLGKRAPAPKGSHYLELSGENAPRKGVYVVHQRVVEDLSVSANDFRSKLLIPPDLVAVQTMTLVQNDGAVIQLTRQRTRWFVGPAERPWRVERRRVEHLMSNLTRFDADPLLDIEAATALLREPAELTLTPAMSEPVTLRIGGACPDGSSRVVVVRQRPEPAAGCVPGSAARAVTDVSLASLIDEHLVHAHADEIETLRIETQNAAAHSQSSTRTNGSRSRSIQGQLELTRRGAGFHLRLPKNMEVDDEAAEQRLKTLTELRGRLLNESAPAEETGSTDDQRRQRLKQRGTRIEVTRRVDDEEVSEVIYVGDLDGDEVDVLREDDGALLRVSAREAHVLVADDAWLLPKRLLDLRLASLRGVRIEGRNRVQRLVRNEAGVFQLDEPQGFDVDGALATALGERLVQLEASRWLSGSTGGSWGFDAPFMKVELDVIEKGQPQSYTLDIGDRTQGGRYARSSKYDGVFVLGLSTLELLDTWLIDRSGFLVRRDSIRTLRLESAEGELRLEQLGDDFETKPRGVLHPSQIEELLELLASLRPEAAVHIGAARPDEGLGRPELSIVIDETVGGKRRQRTLSFGARDVWRQLAVHYARTSTLDASFVIPRSLVAPLLELPLR